MWSPCSIKEMKNVQNIDRRAFCSFRSILDQLFSPSPIADEPAVTLSHRRKQLVLLHYFFFFIFAFWNSPVSNRTLCYIWNDKAFAWRSEVVIALQTFCPNWNPPAFHHRCVALFALACLSFSGMMSTMAWISTMTSAESEFGSRIL